MYLMQTVSAVPRPRAAVHVDSRSPHAHSASIDIQNCIKHLTEDDAYNGYKHSYDRKITENGVKPSHREELMNEYNKQRVADHNSVEAEANRIGYQDEEKDKKKEKKWTLGGFFRRKCRKDADDSSEESGDGRKGFLSRRKSKRDRRKPRTKVTANGFDVIIPQQRDSNAGNNIGKTVEELWGNGDVKSANNGPVRYIYRHQHNGLPDASKIRDTLQVPKHSRRDSNLSRNGSGGSGSLEGRKGRKEVLARAEAKRDQMRDESSSDENESYHSSSSLNRLTVDGKRPRGRHPKQLSRDEESLLAQNGDFRVVKSDFEGHRLPHNRWVPRGVYPDSSDHENIKLCLINHSATPSPARSPRVRQKQLMQNFSPIPAPNSYPVNTFPPGIHYPQVRSLPNYNGFYSNSKYTPTKEPQVHISQPVINLPYRKGNRNSEYIQPARRSTSEHSTNRRTLMDYEQFLSSCGSNRDKSMSYDQDIHRASYFENDPSDVMPYQIAKPTAYPEQLADGRKHDHSPKDPRKIPNPYYDLPQRTPRPYDDGENLSMGSTTNSLPVQHPSHQIVQRSASGNSFCNVYGNSSDAAYNQIRSSSYQHIPSHVNQQSRANLERLKPCVQNGVKYQAYRTMTETVTANPAIVQCDAKERFYHPKESIHSPVKAEQSHALPKPQLNSSVPNLRYYADQNPRSRNPIHITCNPSPTHDQPSDPPVIAKSQQNSVKESITNASDFWKLKDQENIMNMQLKKGTSNASSKPPLTQVNGRAERSRSGSPKSREKGKTGNEAKLAETRIMREDARKLSSSPADLPLGKVKDEAQIKSKIESSNSSSNLDDALNELETIYNSLRLGDEDMTTRAETRDLLPKTDQLVKGRTYDVYPSHEHQRAVPQRRSGVPDKVTDDMAYRRMKAKERTENNNNNNNKKFPAHSYLRSSPALSPVMGDSPNNLIPKESPHEPDVTFDDVVFRNIRHANSTLKIQDPQPPFGIPIGPITPAPNSDYLHATPSERFRPTFSSSKVPDVVKDDLAFRNLRKDNMTANLPVVENHDCGKVANPNYLMQKKRAVRSLSANLYNLIQKESSEYQQIERNNNILEKDSEKTQSLTDLSEKEGKKALEKRLKELKEEKNAKRAEFFELAKEQRRKRNSKSKLSWAELAHLNGDFENVPQFDTSTETLTEDKESIKSDGKYMQQRLRVNFNSEESNKLCQTPEVKYRSPIVELSKYPAAAPSSTLYSNPFREPTPGSPLDEAQLEDLLSALEKEAKNASEDLGRQLVELEQTVKEEDKEVKRRSVSVLSEKTDDTVRYSSLERRKNRRSRNSSVSAIEKDTSPPEEKPLDILDKLCDRIQSEVPTEEKEDVAKSNEDVGKLTNEIIQITEELIRRESKERKRSSVGFEVVTDLSEILHEIDEHQTSKPKDTFQEVYEYNIGLTEGDGSGKEEVDGGGATEGAKGDEPEESENIEDEFEKLHMEMNVSRRRTVDEDDAVVNELIADVTSGSVASSEPYSPRPFPNEVAPKRKGLSCRDGSSLGSSNGEESAQQTSDLCEERDVSEIKEKERLTKMLGTDGDNKLSAQRARIVTATADVNSRNRIESYKENRRKELLETFNSQVEAASLTKPFKGSKRREDLRGGGTVVARGKTPENQVPLSDVRRYISRRDQNKTDAQNGEVIGKEDSQPSVPVRETRTSRLRAATRTAVNEGGSPRARKTPDREKSTSTPSPHASTSNSLNRKEVDKSHKRKSYLNRSHTSEEVYNDVPLSDDSIVSRRSARSSILNRKNEVSPKLEILKLSNGSVGKGTSPKPKVLSLTKTVLPWRKPTDRSASLANGSVLTKQKSVEEKETNRLSASSLKKLEDRFLSRRSSDGTARAYPCPDNGSTKKATVVDKTRNSPDDFARRADLLAAATLKMINRLDEINKNSRRIDQLKPDEVPSSCSSTDRISFDRTLKTFDTAHKSEDRRKLPDENTAKSHSSSPVNRRSSRPKIGTIATKPFEKAVRHESPKPELKYAEVSKPFSILKNKVTSDPTPIVTESRKSKPVSILKRKSLSQDESHSNPPVTFSPSVLANENSKRQGILKKRRSLDENEVLRRRSFCPETGNSEFKPILKNQRRSSLEDISGRSRSPDYLPQSILKRKSSRDEEVEEPSSTGEPQGILKRKTSGQGHQHVKIADSIILAVSEMQIGENIRPILKKKSSSEDHSTPELSVSEPPRPILKKKSSVEVDDEPKKPILKTRKTSAEDSDEGRRSSFADLDHVRPILKRETSRSNGDDISVVRRVKPNRFGRPLSSSDIDDELNAIFNKRRSLEFQFTSAIRDWNLRRAKSVSLSERNKSDALRRPSSVAERVNTLESFLQMERERGNFSPPSPTRVSSPKASPAECSGAKFRQERFVRSSSISDCFSSPSASRETPSNEGVKTEETSKPEKTPENSEEEEEDVICRCVTAEKSDSVRVLPPAIGDSGEAKSATSLFNNETYHSTDSEVSSNGLSNDQDDSEYLSAVESCSRRMSSLDLKDTEPETMAESLEEAKEVSEEIFLLQKSGSVRAKASLFQELEKRLNSQPEEEKPKPKAVNRGINRYREKKLLETNSQKYHTQPISSQDVEEAIRNTQKSSDKAEDVESFEDELSSMSLFDRVRLFNERIRRESNASPPPAAPIPVRKRGPRFKTQPVTTEEVETAQGQRISPLAASLMRPPDPDLFGLGVLSVQSIKEKIYDHANALAKESERKGVLRSGINKQSSESDSSSDSEIRSILKSEETVQRLPSKVDENTCLKSILKPPSTERKAETSSEESSGSDDGGTGKRGANLASILQNVEPVKVSEEKTSQGEGGRELCRFVKNEAVAKRRQMALNKLRSNSSLVKSQSHSAVSSICRTKNDGLKGPVVNGEAEGVKCGSSGDAGWKEDGLKRSTTQPLAGADCDDDMSGASIQERLARLRKSGENDWQKRKTIVSNSEELSAVISSGNYLFNETCMLRSQRVVSPQSQKDSDDLRNSILADRLDKLDAAKEGWRKRVQPSDAVRFSVEGKMQGKSDGMSRSPLLQIGAERKKRCPKPKIFRSRKNLPTLNSVPSSPMEVISNNPIARSVSAPGSGQDGLFSLSVFEGPVVSVPKTDDETFTSFFNGLCSDVVLEERLDIKDEDLDVVSRMQSSQLLVQKRNVKIQRRRATLKNPLKTLAARNDLQEYTETKTGVAEKELKRLKVEKASRNSNLAIEALAGLASSEDFTAVNLKKASDGGVNSSAPPFKSLMLLQVKGRRHVQTRLVEPVAGSINAGDCFILVTPKKLFHYVGEYANVIEKSRAAEICLHIQQNSDLGCVTSSMITIGGGGRATTEQVKDFWRLLGDGGTRERPAGHPDEDEIFESAVVDTNMIYEVVNDELVPLNAFWGAIPKIEVLDSNKVLVFDFGSEFYVWIGKNVNIPNRKVALKLARELWEDGYDYSECDVCPLTLDSYFDDADAVPESAKAGPARPSWALFAKITENMETVLFREKFLDWPDYSRVIRRSKKGEECEGVDGSGVIEAKPCDARAMLEHVRSEPDLVLEGSHLGRGVRYYEEETRRCAEVTTRDVTVWHISEYEYSELPKNSIGQFHMEDSYVVRWHYMITITGRELSGQPSKHLTVGRDRYAYFCWQGRDSPINDKGAAACLTVELDKEHGPQVRVMQGFEPPAFLNLFRGEMVVHSGRRDSDAGKKWRMFICRGDDCAETSLVEVPTSMRQLRSGASFVLVSAERGLIIVWHGLRSPDHVRKMAANAARRVQSKSPKEFSFGNSDLRVREEEEGEESMEFFRAVGGEKRQLYYSLLENKSEELQTPRLFHLSSVSGEFLFSEVSPPMYNREVVSPYPFLQEDLYSAPQPALFMIDTGHCLWLWQGWWEAEVGEGDRGSGMLRFQAERRAAMTTAISYWNLKYGSSTPKAYLVWAGLEPLVFTNLFPMWTDRDQIAEINMKEGRKPGEAVPAKTELASLTQSTYPLAQLQSRPLPDGVNPSFLEDYLEPQCFQSLFGMTLEEFSNLPSWKKKKLKQEAGLF